MIKSYIDFEEILTTNKLFKSIVKDSLKNKIIILYELWTEKFRYYHGLDHFYFILEKIKEDDNLTIVESEALAILAVYHDAIIDSVQKSAILFIKDTNNNKYSDFIYNSILDTGKHIIPKNKYNKREFELLNKFISWDLWYLNHADVSDIITTEYKVYKEYQKHDYENFKQERSRILQTYITKDNINIIKNIIDYINSRTIKVGVYAGSFNPLHLGHINIINKAENIFDKVIIAAGYNPEKKLNDLCFLPNDMHKNVIYNNLLDKLKYYDVRLFEGFLPEFLNILENKNSEITLIRGLRTGFDFNYEQKQLQYIKDMKSGIKIVYIPCDKEYEHISSTDMKLLESIKIGSSKKYLA